MVPCDGMKVFETALALTENIAYYVPKTTDAEQLASLAGPRGR